MRNVAAEVPLDKIKCDEIQKLVQQMKKVLRNYHLVGIGAPQIGVSYRIIVIEASERLKEKYPAAVYKNRQMDILPMTVGYISILTISLGFSLESIKLHKYFILSTHTDFHQSRA